MITHTASELAAICGAELEGDGALRIEGPASLTEAGPREISFLGNSLYRTELERTRAGAVLVAPGGRPEREDLTLLLCEDPNRAFSLVISSFQPAPDGPSPGVHPTAHVDPGAELGSGVALGPNVVVSDGARVGARAVLHAGVVVGRDVRIGEDSVLHPGVVLYPRVELGRGCTVHAGSVLGADGFGFDPTPSGWEKVPQCGGVVIEDDVEIGANCAVDRARFGTTRIGRGAKLDNLVHIAHNVVVEEGALLIAQTGVAGSSRIGKRAILAGQTGISGHVRIGAGARVGGQGGVIGDVPPDTDVWGTPARERGETLRVMALTRRLPELFKRLKELEDRVAKRED